LSKNVFKPSKEQIDEIAEYLKGAGRRGDNELAHLTKGEIILPKSVIDELDPKVLEAAFKSAGRDLGRYTVGQNDDSFNPSTGLREYADSEGQGTSESGATGHDGGGGGGGGGNDGGYADNGSTDDGQGGSQTGTGGIGGNTTGGNDGYADNGDTDDGQGGGRGAPDGIGGYADRGNTDDGQGGSRTGTGGLGGSASLSDSQRDAYSQFADAMDSLGGKGGLTLGGVGGEGYSKADRNWGESPTAQQLGNQFGWAGRVVGRAIDNPIATAINSLASIALGPLGALNTVSGIAGGATIGGTATAAGRSVSTALDGISVSLTNALGEFAPSNMQATNNPNDPNQNDMRGGGNDSVAAVAQAAEQATGQVATTIDSSNYNQGTIATTSTDRRRAFSRLTLGSRAGNKASLLW
jgi:hypothetical protein